MTIEEKRQAIREYCKAHQNCSCGHSIGFQGHCPLWDTTVDCSKDAVEGAVERGYRLLLDAGAFPHAECAAPTAEFDPVNRPKHYNREGAMESIDEMILVFGREAVMHFCLCNAWKYRYRATAKNGEEDLKKSDWYMKKYRELKEASNAPA